MNTKPYFAAVAWAALAAFGGPDTEAADRTVRGEVTVVNIPWTFKDNRIDWLFNPTKRQGPFNPEWTWQLNRMSFWYALARAYRETGDEKYARAFARQAEDWLDQTGGVPPEEGYNDVGSPWRTIEEGLRLMGSWPTAWNAFRKSPSFPEPLRTRFVAAMRAQAKHLMKHRTVRNWLLMEMNGVHAFATLFPDFPESTGFRREAARILGDELRSQLLPDGFQYELSPDYHIVLMHCLCPLYRRARESGHLDELPQDFRDLLAKAVDSQLALMTPSFVQPRFNDCYTMHTEGYVKCVEGILPERADYRWVKSHGREGRPPDGATASRYLPWSGFAAMRSGWTADATYLCFDVGPLGRAHYHQDKLSFTFWKGGEELVFDDGGGQYEVSAMRDYGLSGYDHNTLLVDGLAQNRREPRQAAAPIDAGWESTPTRDRAVGVYDQGFGPKELRLATHRREIVFDKAADAFTITDDVRSADGRDHDYTLLFHLDTTNVTVAADGRSLYADYGPGRRWALALSCEGEGVRIMTASGRIKPTLAGWFVGRNDLSNHVATTVFVNAPKGRDRRFTTTLRARRCLPAACYPCGRKVVIEDEFWSPKFALWRTNTVFDVFEKLDRRSHALENFDRVARGEKGGHRGAHFFDGLLYESIRGACDYLAREPSADLEKLIDGAVDRIVAAQRSDGYLHTWVQLGHAERQWGDNGGCALEQHEVYDAGALIEAGVHHYRATGKTKLLKAGVKFANLLCDTMGPPPKRNHIPTHSLAEEALVKLARLGRAEPDLSRKLGVPVRSGDYLALVKFWFDSHGRHCGAPEWERHGAHNGGAPKAMALVHEMTKAKHDPAWRPCWGDYQMDRVPLADYRSIEGYAVRAALLGTGLAAYAAETGDATVAALATRFWESMTGRKMYVTGGVGARSDFERFGDDWELPPDAYLETCAAVASAFYSGWMAERTGDGRYMDEFERVIYNALLTAVGTNGCTYTYQNPLNTAKGDRWDWHGCPCCPPMFLKLTGALPGYVYATDAAGLRVNLFMGSRTEFDRAGVRVGVAQRTRYPEDGRIAIAVDPERPASFRLAVRIPGWARGVESWSGLYHADGERTWSLALNGQPLKPALEKGYACVDRVWRKGDVLTVGVDVSPRTIRADSHVAAVRGLHAVACGPVVMAEERGRMIPYWRVANEGPAPHRVWLEDPAVKVSVKQ